LESASIVVYDSFVNGSVLSPAPAKSKRMLVIPACASVGHAGEAAVFVASAPVSVVDHDEREPLVLLPDGCDHRGRDLDAARGNLEFDRLDLVAL
jgi:hypothetical protein